MSKVFKELPEGFVRAKYRGKYFKSLYVHPDGKVLRKSGKYNISYIPMDITNKSYMNDAPYFWATLEGKKNPAGYNLRNVIWDTFKDPDARDIRNVVIEKDPTKGCRLDNLEVALSSRAFRSIRGKRSYNDIEKIFDLYFYKGYKLREIAEDVNSTPEKIRFIMTAVLANKTYKEELKRFIEDNNTTLDNLLIIRGKEKAKRARTKNKTILWDPETYNGDDPRALEILAWLNKNLDTVTESIDVPVLGE